MGAVASADGKKRLTDRLASIYESARRRGDCWRSSLSFVDTKLGLSVKWEKKIVRTTIFCREM